MEIGARQLRSWRANLVFGARQMQRVTCDKIVCMQSTARAHLLAAGEDGTACLVHADEAQHLGVLGLRGCVKWAICIQAMRAAPGSRTNATPSAANEYTTVPDVQRTRHRSVASGGGGGGTTGGCAE